LHPWNLVEAISRFEKHRYKPLMGVFMAQVGNLSSIAYGNPFALRFQGRGAVGRSKTRPAAGMKKDYPHGENQ
jgi:hypothetical protein